MTSVDSNSSYAPAAPNSGNVFRLSEKYYKNTTGESHFYGSSKQKLYKKHIKNNRIKYNFPEIIDCDIFCPSVI